MSSQEISCIAIIGVGEVGGCYARALSARARLLLFDIKDQGPPIDTSSDLGLNLHGQVGPILPEAEVVLVCTPGIACLEVANGSLDYLSNNSQYFDLSTAAPGALRQAAETFKSADRNFTDIAIMSSIQLSAETAPLLVAGPGRDIARSLFSALGARVDFVDGEAEAGEATSLKLLRSIIIKGLECLAVEALTAAESVGLRQQLMAVLRDLDEQPLQEMFEMMITTHAPHGLRRGHEMEEATEQLRGMGFDALMTSLVAKRYEKTVAAKQHYAGAEEVMDMETSLAWLRHAVR